MQPIFYRKQIVDGLKIFFRESGPENAPVILLLHGYPTSSFMFRNLIPPLNNDFQVIAPDLPGFGFSEKPSREFFSYTFDHLALTMYRFIDSLKLTRFSRYVFDYGAPGGYRIAVANAEKVISIISQNGNAYFRNNSFHFIWQYTWSRMKGNYFTIKILSFIYTKQS
jgi:pimeloyl-ACP methyl ester carboxylesterase